MTVEELIVYGKKYIHSDLAKLLLSSLLNLNSLELLNHLQDIVDDSVIEEYKKQVNLVKEKKPVQYVVGNVDFYGNIIDVNENVLIPRFETEELVEKTINYLKDFPNQLDIADLGTGSGCIAIALKKNLNCNVDAVDISKDALEQAQHNIRKHNLDINLIESDMLTGLEKKYDCLISNPPYISYDEEIMEIVKDNEPHIALYAKDNGLYYYKEIIKNANKYLKDKYLIAFEIGYTQGDFLAKYAKLYFPNDIIKVEKDMQGKDRFLFIIHK